ncbi:hypothetical protein WICMUC_005341 [Wickerhamomyces mucosus]|uniref:F-box domain-containing protein n=1 Tax=Wickerhamomyces mucosus TaxID=1378264 RepID=A0A9P8T638_9ASCO|nr:hypothetical protein WICMUC_005341 [Wickerhamomyces mucosus]
MNTNASLFSLGGDIIESEIIPLLTLEEMNTFKATCKTLSKLVEKSSYIWKEQFKKTFGTKPTPFALSKWPELYRLRSRGKLYAWGTMSGGRLGFAAREVPKENLSRARFNLGVCKPTQVPRISENTVLADVSAGGFSFQILTSDGDIFSTGSYNQGHYGDPGPIDDDFDQFRHSIVGQNHLSHILPLNIGNTGANTLDGVSPVFRTPMTLTDINSRPYITTQIGGIQSEPNSHISNIFLNKETANGTSNIKFISVSSGRSHFIALDSSGSLWSWDRSKFGVKIRFENQDGTDLENLGHKVLRAVAGWDSSVAYLYRFGLVYWTKRFNLKEGDKDALALYKLIPYTSDISGVNKVTEFLALEGCLIYLTSEGRVFKNDFVGEASYELSKFSARLKDMSRSLSPKFIRLTGSFRSFAVFSNEDFVFLGTNTSSEPEIIDELQCEGCVNVSFGDYHSLALLKDGTILSWGLESNNCGCLGLGQADFVIHNHQGINDGGLRVTKPTIVPIERKAIAIAAGGWQSSAIMV